MSQMSFRTRDFDIEDPGLLLRLFEANVRERGDSLALIDGDERLSFAALDAKANSIAASIFSRAPAARLIGVHLPPGSDAVACVIAALKLGGAYLPLDPEHPDARNRYIVEAARPGLVVSESTWDAGAAVTSCRVLAEGGEKALTDPQHDPLLKVVFTSGSTGDPKGVRIPKRALVNRLAWMQDEYPLGEGDVVLLQKPLVLVAAAVEVFQGLAAGVPTVIAARNVVRDPALLWDLLREESVSHVLASPAFWSGLVDHAESTGESLPALRFASTSAEPMPVGLARRWLAAFPGIPFLNLYGSTECSSNALAFDIRDLATGDKVVPIGQALRNVRVSIRDESHAPVEKGVVGEMFISGACLAMGYLEDALTRRCFTTEPVTGDTILHTGDLVYERGDGNIVLVGRSDNRLNIDGYRIEPEEIEQALLAHPSVRECAVAMVNGRLTAYVVGDSCAAADLRAFLEPTLPQYMLPRAWATLVRLPRNAAGKVDRKSLPLPPAIAPDTAGYRAASSPLEELVATIWSDVLGTARAGMDDDFHLAGGSSVQAARILARLRGATGARVSYEAFMTNSTPAGIAETLREQMNGSEAEGVATAWLELQRDGGDASRARYRAALEARGLDDDLELPAPTAALSFGQASLWFFQKLRPESPTYNLAYAYRLRGGFSVAALRAALYDILAANENLRSAFVDRDGRPEVLIRPVKDCKPAIPVDRLGAGEAQDYVDRCARRPFDLAAEPLLRGHVGEISPEDHLLVIVVHHIVFDGWSRRLLLNQLEAGYRRHLSEEADAPAQQGAPYRAFPELQRRWVESAEGQASLAWWRNALSGLAEPVTLPPDRERPATHPHSGRKAVQYLDQALSDRLDSVARAMQTTPFAVLLTGFKLLLKAQGVDDLAVGVPVANRERPEFERTIGYFVNTAVVRSAYEDGMTVEEAVRREAGCVNEALDHGAYPFDRLVSELSVKRSLAYNPLYQLIFNMLGEAWDSLALEGAETEIMSADNGGSQVDVSIAARRSGKGYSLTWEYCDALYEPRSVEAWQARYLRTLEQMIVDPARPLSAVLAAVSEADREQRKVMSDASRDSRLERLRKAREARAGSRASSLQISRGRRRVISDEAATDEEKIFDDLDMIRISPAVRGLDAVSWAEENASSIRQKLIECGGILFRGFDIADGKEFERFFHAACGNLNEYTHRVTKRTQAGDSFVYTSTDHPKTLDLSLHNETSYTKQWPAQIGFFCETPSAVGGQTPVADSRKVLAALPEELRERFAEKQLLYMRNSGNSIELPWQETFQTDDRGDVEAYCDSHDMQYEWKPDGQLRTFQQCQVMARHPVTGDEVWFNQAHMMHRSAYAPGVIERMFPDTPDDHLPFNVFFADRSPIPDADIARINAVYQENARAFDWEKGDVMILDNMLMAHGRRPFDGPRRILVAMSGTIDAADAALPASDGA